jgi:hypothetical protein
MGSNNLSTAAVVFIVFLILKLTDVIDWSWWWVTSPLWLPIVFGLALIFVVLMIALISIAINERNVD